MEQTIENIMEMEKKLDTRPLELKIERKKVAIFECKMLDEIMQEICETPVTQYMYVSLEPYRDAFLADFIKDKACHGGSIGIYVGQDDSWSPTEVKVLDVTMRDFKTCLDNISPIVINIDLWLGRPPTVGAKVSRRAHANVLLIDPKNKVIEYFEPHGVARWTSMISDLVRDLVQNGQLSDNSTPFIDYEFISPIDYCPRFGWQAIAQDAMCANWALLYSILRIMCPNQSRDIIVNNLLSIGKDKLLDLMQRWHCYIARHIRQREPTVSAVPIPSLGKSIK
jgi:hypothetical protein